MKNENKPNGTAPVTTQANPIQEVEAIYLLQKIESHLATGLKSQWAMVKSLKSIDASLNILAAQKKREVDPEVPQTAKP